MTDHARARHLADYVWLAWWLLLPEERVKRWTLRTIQRH